MTKLRKLNLHANSIETIEENAFCDLIDLLELDLSKNNLSSINETNFVGLNKLTILKLSQNNIVTIHKKTFKNLIKLKYLDLSKNALQTFNFKLISSMRQILEFLYLQHNQLNELKISKNLCFPALSQFNVHKNKFDCCKLQPFFESCEGKALIKSIEYFFNGIVCDGYRKLDENKNMPNLNCTERIGNSFDSMEMNMKSSGCNPINLEIELKFEVIILVFIKMLFDLHS